MGGFVVFSGNLTSLGAGVLGVSAFGVSFVAGTVEGAALGVSFLGASFVCFVGCCCCFCFSLLSFSFSLFATIKH